MLWTPNSTHTTQGWPQSRRKKFCQAIDLLFHRLSQEKVNVIMTFKCQPHQLQQYNRSVTTVKFLPSQFRLYASTSDLLPNSAKPFSSHLLGRIATPRDRNDPVYPVNKQLLRSSRLPVMSRYGGREVVKQGPAV